MDKPETDLTNLQKVGEYLLQTGIDLQYLKLFKIRTVPFKCRLSESTQKESRQIFGSIVLRTIES